MTCESAMPEYALDDAIAIARAQRGDTAAFESLYQAHHGRVYALCVRLSGDRALAEDLVQEVFVKAWCSLGKFRGDARLSTWLHRLAVNTAVSQRRRRAPWFGRFAIDIDALPEDAARETPGLARDLDAAIARLPTRARQVFVLVDLEGYSHEEAGAALGVAVGTSKAQLHRARSLLREMLQ